MKSKTKIPAMLEIIVIQRLLRYISKTHPIRCRQVSLRSLIGEELPNSSAG